MEQQPDPLTGAIIGCAMEVHRCLGPGLVETTYEQALCIELTNACLLFERQLHVPILYKGQTIGEYRPDLVVEGLQRRVLVEIKSVERLIGLHRAQALAYMRVMHLQRGLLLNFNVEMLKHGIRRLAI
jgi:GxxExxY protein